MLRPLEGEGEAQRSLGVVVTLVGEHAALAGFMTHHRDLGGRCIGVEFIGSDGIGGHDGGDALALRLQNTLGIHMTEQPDAQAGADDAEAELIGRHGAGGRCVQPSGVADESVHRRHLAEGPVGRDPVAVGRSPHGAQTVVHLEQCDADAASAFTRLARPDGRIDLAIDRAQPFHVTVGAERGQHRRPVELRPALRDLATDERLDIGRAAQQTVGPQRLEAPRK